MKRLNLFSVVLIFLLFSCSSGKKAMEKGDYFGGAEQAINRLRSKPSDEKAAAILKDSYSLMLKWVQDETDLKLSQNNIFKWEEVMLLLQRVNDVSSLIRRSPAALKIIPEPKVYTSELEMAVQKAAEARYNEGVRMLESKLREDARLAFVHFDKCNLLIPGYRDVKEKMMAAKSSATVRVIVESIPVHAKAFQLTAGFFYDQVLEFLNNRFKEKSFVRFYTPEEAERMEIRYPDMVLRLEFYDFVVGDAVHNESEQEVSRDEKIATKDTNKVEIKTYRAKIKTVTDKIISGGLLEVRITDFQASRLLFSDKVPGQFTWQNQYAVYVGDVKALNDTQKVLVSRSVVVPPSPQSLFMEFTRPIYEQLTGKLAKFFGDYN
jgi:hypothetical protein